LRAQGGGGDPRKVDYRSGSERVGLCTGLPGLPLGAPWGPGAPGGVPGAPRRGLRVPRTSSRRSIPCYFLFFRLISSFFPSVRPPLRLLRQHSCHHCLCPLPGCASLRSAFISHGLGHPLLRQGDTGVCDPGAPALLTSTSRLRGCAFISHVGSRGYWGLGPRGARRAPKWQAVPFAPKAFLLLAGDAALVGSRGDARPRRPRPLDAARKTGFDASFRSAGLAAFRRHLAVADGAGGVRAADALDAR